MTLIFVYGTLKRGGSNHSWLAGQRFVGPARTGPGYVLYELEGYPGMVMRDDALEGVSGEVWSVDAECLEGLDRLEGTDEGLYRRVPVALREPIAEEPVETYLYLLSVDHCRRLGGDWTG